MAETFSSLPILPLSHALDPATKPKFLEDLRHALLNVGFLYLSETGLPDQLIKDVNDECQGFFVKLPQEEKERIEMKNEKSFLGWSRVSLWLSFDYSMSMGWRYHWGGVRYVRRSMMIYCCLYNVCDAEETLEYAGDIAMREEGKDNVKKITRAAPTPTPRKATEYLPMYIREGSC
jgi:isopenicillin N synthase-like dioxygenase